MQASALELNLLYCLINNMVAMRLLQDEREILLYAVVFLARTRSAEGPRLLHRYDKVCQNDANLLSSLRA